MARCAFSIPAGIHLAILSIVNYSSFTDRKVDQPVGTGFSFTRKGGLAQSIDEVSQLLIVDC